MKANYIKYSVYCGHYKNAGNSFFDEPPECQWDDLVLIPEGSESDFIMECPSCGNELSGDHIEALSDD